MTLFGTDGVRGRAGEKLTPTFVSQLAMAAGIHFRKLSRTNKILVGKDTRRSGYMIENALVSGLTAVGYNVIQIGPMPTPAIAFLTANMRCDAGIMISASHNPFDDNGIKFFDRNGNKLSASEEKDIEAIFTHPDQVGNSLQVGTRIGASKRIDDVIGRYIVHIKNSFPKELTLSGMRVVIDAANGAAYKVAPTVLSELGAELFVIGDEPDGFNINEECGAMHPGALAKKVRQLRADIGFALDGDADRLVVVDENGDQVDGDKLLGALALALKAKGELKGGGCVATVMSNGALADFLKTHGITLHRSAVGDKHVLELMQERGINFGGEQSGHIIFSDYAKTGDGLVSALRTLALVIESGQKASEVLNPFDLYPQKQSALPVAQKHPLDKIEGLQALLEEIEQAQIRHLVRYSGTEMKLRILLEGPNRRELDHYFDRLTEHLKAAHGL